MHLRMQRLIPNLAFLAIFVLTAPVLHPQSGQLFQLSPGLQGLPILNNAETRSVSPENPTGEKGKGGMAIPNPSDPDLPYSKASVNLGQGWKVRPFVKPRAGAT